MDLKRWEFTRGHEGSSSPTIDEWEASAGNTHKNFARRRNEQVNWTPLTKPLHECTVALVTSGGVHAADDPPFDTAAHEGDWSIRAIPNDINCSSLRISHTHYNHGDADEDVNCMFPLDRLREFADNGRIGRAAPTHYGLMGFIPDPEPLVRETIPALIDALSTVDVVVFSPG